MKPVIIIAIAIVLFIPLAVFAEPSLNVQDLVVEKYCNTLAFVWLR